MRKEELVGTADQATFTLRGPDGLVKESRTTTIDADSRAEAFMRLVLGFADFIRSKGVKDD